jgi:uncharacterized membrane protein (DUF4010 family)
MMADNLLIADLGWRIILIAGLANLAFKGGVAQVLGGTALGRRIAVAFGIALLIGTALVLWWPSPTISPDMPIIK